ncbi:hypothetical protein FGG08_005660 [Glutinoglossum americanum]|uniref:Uncharacterized protein n=1 Tax=Glutinoglossum americanum TaxID=1670608 RepID=A0A9P8I2K2_9PEZI|nr:hypothetical protein FGG08_005660 [Glutinoglossum americanum]
MAGLGPGPIQPLLQQPSWDSLLSAEVDGSSSYLLTLRQQLDQGCLRTQEEPSIPVGVIGERIEHLSSALIQLENQDTPLQREFQFRALISALALAKYNRFHSFSAPLLDTLYSNITDRFRELVFQPQPLTDVENVHKANSSYLVRFALEHVKLFSRAEPMLVSMLPHIFRTLLGAALLTSGQLNGVDQICQGIDALSRFWRNPQPRYQVLLGLQDLTRAAVAINLKAKLAKDDTLWAFSIKMARRTLRELLNTLGNAAELEATPLPSAAQGYWEQFLAIVNRGSPGLNKYFYFYGLLDCAAQLGRILHPDELPAEMKLRMMRLLLGSKVPQFRWKATEILLSFTATRDREYGQLSEHISAPNLNITNRAQLAGEINVIRRYLEGEDLLPANLRPENTWHPQGPRRDSRSSSSTGQQDVGPPATPPTTPPEDWREEFEKQDMLRSERPESVHPSLPKRLFRRSKSYISCGLSSDCSHAFLLNAKSLCIYSLPITEGQSVEQVTKKTFTEKSKENPDPIAPTEAVLSQRFLATIASEKLVVYEYRSESQLKEVASHRFKLSYLCGVALHESEAPHRSDNVMVLVGRRRRSEGQLEGHIDLLGYRVNDNSSKKLDKIFTFNLAIGDTPKMLAFGLGGTAFVCATAILNDVLVWPLTDELLSSHPEPYKVPRNFPEELRANGITSASLFTSSSGRSYVLCTTSPTQKYNVGREQSFISPVFLQSESLHLDLVHFLEPLNRRQGLIAGAALSHTNVIAVAERTGKIMVLPLTPHDGGGIHSDIREPLELNNSLFSEAGPPMNCLRFNPAGTHLYAIDVKGEVIIKRFTWPPVETNQPP